MSRLYRYFLTTALLVLIAVFSTFIFYPQNLSDTSEYEQNHALMKNSIFLVTPPVSAAKYVVILAYQRCGSSFVGEVFNLNPNAFYAFEPLDSLYSAMYGTTPGWNVPSDITNDKDGTVRKIPQVEINAVADFLRYLLTAEVDKLPTATLVHKFWTLFGDQHKETINFQICLKRHNLTNVRCYGITRNYCGTRFGHRPPVRIEECRRLLANEITMVHMKLRISRIFNSYSSCFESYRQRVDAHCTELLQKAIAGHPLRATKVVRATMDSMGPLLRSLPTLRVIHLVRDPRSVAVSRWRFSASGRGEYTERVGMISRSRIVAEASLYCHHVTADIRSRLALEREFPGRIMWMRYEDVVSNPEQKFRDIYKLLDEPVPTETLDKMQRLTAEGQTKNVTTKWQNVLTAMDEKEIIDHCSEFFQLIGVSPNRIPLTSTTHKRGNYSLICLPSPYVERSRRSAKCAPQAETIS